MPFYNVSGAVRTILFGTKNERKSQIFSPPLLLLTLWGFSGATFWDPDSVDCDFDDNASGVSVVYAAGECSGFDGVEGGGGERGKALEGTFCTIHSNDIIISRHRYINHNLLFTWTYRILAEVIADRCYKNGVLGKLRSDFPFFFCYTTYGY